MRSRNSGSRNALEVKVDYVESKLDETIKSFKEAIEKSEARLDADRKASEARLAADREAELRRREEAERRIENDRIAAENRLANDRLEFEKRFAEERKEWRSTKRALYLNFGGVVALIITVVLALMNGTIPG